MYRLYTTQRSVVVCQCGRMMGISISIAYMYAHTEPLKYEKYCNYTVL